MPLFQRRQPYKRILENDRFELHAPPIVRAGIPDYSAAFTSVSSTTFTTSPMIWVIL
jgi:hypothetical protein